MTPRRSLAILVATALALAACGGGNDASPTPSPTTTITDSQRGVLLAEAACAVVLPEDVETAFDRTVVGGGEVGACRLILEPGLAGSDMIVQVTIWIAQADLDPRQLFETRRVKDGIVDVSGVGFPAVYDPLTSDVWILVEPSNATLPGRASGLGSVEVAVLDLQVLLPGVGVAPDDVRDEILAGLRSLIAAVAPRL